ncbi:Retrovirus-related Pol polyprotein type-2 like protein [Argiope bruennichi]|uniref:Retrovirus-related Pol polyprotein type-2 like protein n=1 Tax=Argiope bruennichi TaxID=94029 RepID=A0A8T0EPC6_ARGBR|nr:Retrovirus-related Pol polyprotein type-2 like protein [Argiope bruennichi]
MSRNLIVVRFKLKCGSPCDSSLVPAILAEVEEIKEISLNHAGSEVSISNSLSSRSLFQSGIDVLQDDSLEEASPTFLAFTEGRRPKKKKNTLNHISQACPRTHKNRITRHNAVNNYLVRALERRKYTVHQEPIFDTPSGKRKPDIVAIKDNKIFVIDTLACQGTSPEDLLLWRERDTGARDLIILQRQGSSAFQPDVEFRGYVVITIEDRPGVPMENVLCGRRFCHLYM